METTDFPLACGPLEPWTLEVDATVIVGGALCTLDYYPVHHDTRAAHDKGLPDIILNSPTLEGYLLRYITDSLGPSVRVLGITYRLFQPTVPGDVLHFTGEVLHNGEGYIAELEVTHQRGVASSAKVTLG